MRILLVHHTGYHFDTALAARRTLEARHTVALWSNALDQYGRRALAERLGIRLHQAGADYDALVVVTADAMPDPDTLGADVAALLRRRPTVRLLHRFAGRRDPATLHLFGGAPLPFVPVDCGVPVPPRTPAAIRSLLVQGNIEPRRDYAVLPRLAAAFPDLAIRVVGKTTAKMPAGLDGLDLRRDLDEIDFHAACASSGALAPLLDPARFPGYFADRFTSSVMIAFAYGLPVIAHWGLFALYPLAGLSYRDDAGLFACVEAARALEPAEVGRLSEDMAAAAASLQARNRDHFDIALAEAGAG